MRYRPFGKTGVDVSVLGFGCMRLPEYEKDGKWYIDEDKAIPMLHKAFEKGVNYYDTAPYYCHSNSEITLGKAMKDRRDKVYLSTKSPVGDIKETADYRKFLERSLKKMDTDYIDFYHFWGINKQCFDDVIIRLNLLGEAAKAKEEGLIRHISFSFHDAPPNIQYIIDTAEQYGVPLETMLVQYNLLDRGCEDMIAYAASKGLGVVAMGPVGGGRLAKPTEFAAKLSAGPSYELAFKFVLGNPNISCALSGMQTMEMVEQNAVIGDAPPLTPEEWDQLNQSVEQLKKFSDLYCTGCAYCQPCPSKINIPHIFNLFTHHNVYGLSEHARNSYRHYKEKENGATYVDCKDCGYCERKCPQKLEIRKLLKRVDEVLMSL